MALDGFLTIKQAAGRADPPVSTTRVRQVALQGRFPGAFKLGRDWVIPVQDFEKWDKEPRRWQWARSRKGGKDGG